MEYGIHFYNVSMFLLFGRLAASVPETQNNHSQFSPNTSTLSPSFPSAPSLGMFSDLHSSLAPPKPPRAFSESPITSMENLSGIDYFKKRQAPQPPGYPLGSPMTEINLDNEAQVHNASEKPSVPLPDYETLFPKKRHGVMGQTRWDHVIAEVSQRNWDLSEEMNVDGPEQQPVSYKSTVLKDRTSVSLNQHHKEPLIPPKPTSSVSSKPLVEGNIQYRRHVPQETEREAFQAKEKPTPAARSNNSKADRDLYAQDVAKDMPSAKPRQRSVVMDPVGQVQPDKQVTSQPAALERNQAKKPHNNAITSAPTKNGAAQRDRFNLEAFDEADQKDGISASKKTSDTFTKTPAAKTENKSQSPSFTEQARATFQRNFSLKKKNPRHYQTTTKDAMEKSSLDRSVSQSSQDTDDVELTVTSVGMLEASDPSMGGKTTVRAWVSSSEAPPVTLQNGSGTAVSNSRR